MSAETEPDPEAPGVDPPSRLDRAGATVRVDLARRRDGRPPRGRDLVTTEEPLEIRLISTQGDLGVERRIAVTMRTPGEDFDLAAGFLYSEGVIAAAKEIAEIRHCTDPREPQRFNIVTVVLRPGVSFDARRLERNFFATSSCGVCGKASLETLRLEGQGPVAAGPKVREQVIRALPGRLRAAQEVFARTGGIHAAGLFTAEGELGIVREDVGRHNALDKVVGALLQRGELPASDRVLLVSGRASFELVQKAVRAGIPVIAAVGAPSSLAVDTAAEFGATLLGFVGESGFNIYTGSERIVSPE